VGAKKCAKITEKLVKSFLVNCFVDIFHTSQDNELQWQTKVVFKGKPTLVNKNKRIKHKNYFCGCCCAF
jgi:hypothetical protein